MQNLIVTIAQNDFSKTVEIAVKEGVKLTDVSNIVSNAVHSYMTMEKVLVSPKNRAKLNKPFQFFAQLEDSEGKELKVIPSFSSKISLSENGVQNLAANMPMTLAHLLIPLDMPVSERLAKLKESNTLLLETV